MRLIDADAFIEELKKEEWRLDEINTVENFKEIIERVQTAYDVEKVVEHLEKDAFIGRYGECDIYANVIKMDDAVKIVRNGGKE